MVCIWNSDWIDRFNSFLTKLVNLFKPYLPRPQYEWPSWQARTLIECPREICESTPAFRAPWGPVQSLAIFSFCQCWNIFHSKRMRKVNISYRKLQTCYVYTQYSELLPRYINLNAVLKSEKVSFVLSYKITELWN